MFTEEFRKYLIIGITVILLAVIIICSKMGSKGPLKNTSFKLGIILSESLDSVNDWTKRQFSFAGNIFDMKKEVEKYKEENEELKSENVLLKKYKQENDELRQLLDIETKDPAKEKITARIVGVDPNNVYKVYIINKGTKAGIDKDMIVLSSNGLAGRIIEVGSNYSKFMAITDDRTTIGVAIERTGEKLILNGNNIGKSNTCKIDNIDLDSDILVDDVVLTSNVSMLYPESLQVGKIKSIKVAKDELTKSAIVETYTNVNSLNYVYVIKNKEMLEDEIEEVYNELDITVTY
ncbi:MAG: rod shape-determining protein MreC [Clostridia bacterium]|nr:rod shape-determining protein MreC [Clostridia bacterium]